MPVSIYFFLAGGTILWCLPFALVRAKRKDAYQIDRRARWGMALQCLSYSLLWQGRFWERAPEAWRLGLAAGLFVGAWALSWTAARALGKHLRLDASLDAGHELIRTGAYRLVRHPIYTSMLCVLLGTGVLVAPVYLAGPAALVFVAGTEIRIRVEERMLAARFGESYAGYRRDAARWIPFVK